MSCRLIHRVEAPGLITSARSRASSTFDLVGRVVKRVAHQYEVTLFGISTRLSRYGSALRASTAKEPLLRYQGQPLNFYHVLPVTSLRKYAWITKSTFPFICTGCYLI